VLLDQLLVLGHVQQQVDDAELLGDAQLAFGVGRHGRGSASADRVGRRRVNGLRMVAFSLWRGSERDVAFDGGAVQLAALVVGQPAARCISERLSQNTMSCGCHWWR
jgi:hypothetical protein